MYKNIKYLGINLTKEVQDLYTEYNKTLLREIKEYLNKRRDNLSSQIINLYIGKILIFSQIDL